MGDRRGRDGTGRVGGGRVGAGLVGVWLVVGRVAAPFVRLLLGYRAARGKEDRARLAERFGRAGLPRPPGAVVWVHAASVGETAAVLPLIEWIVGRGAAVVFTSGTVTSAAIAAERLPAGAVHQFAPVDTEPAVGRFLAHWRPAAAIFVESELWPAMLDTARRTGVARIVVNGRLSERSARGWSRVPATAAAVFGSISLCLAQGEADAARFRRLGAGRVVVTGNLKADRPALDADAADLARLEAAIGGRPRWLAASTHPGEEEIVAAAHAALAAGRPGLLTIVVPRHPNRGPTIAAMLRGRGLAAALRSRGEAIRPDTAVYVADTIGELGLFYRLVPAAFVGGSLAARGGQNPLEPVALGVAVVTGPEVGNFAEIYGDLIAAQAVAVATSATALAAGIGALLDAPDLAATRRAAAEAVAARHAGALARTCDVLAPELARLTAAAA